MLTPPTLSECVDDALMSMKAALLHITRFIYQLQFQQHIALIHVLYPNLFFCFFFISEEIPRVKGALLSQFKCFRHILIQKTNTQRDCLVLSE